MNGAGIYPDIDWTFEGTWPYEPKWFEGQDGRMHYIDEGPPNARPVVMVHGAPTWGYLYRHFIKAVVDAGYRAVVFDHLGFGRSEKPDKPELYRIPKHAERAIELLESLDLVDATLVTQDWGGPIGLTWAARHPDRIKSLVILNTFYHPRLTDVALPLPLRLFRTKGIGEVMVKGLHAMVKVFLFKAGVARRERMTSVVRKAYLTPHPTYSSRTPILVFPREIPSGADSPVSRFLSENRPKLLDGIRGKPVLIAWPMDDLAFTTEYLDLWTNDLPDAQVLKVENAGHYIQEDAHEVVTPAIVTFLKNNDG